jgi:hypothetical protein
VSPRSFHIVLAAIGMVVLLGMGLDVMEVDAAQYASMSRDMMLRGDVLHLFFRDADYLDKPPLLFWLSALSFKLFGVHDWSYRLPSVLFACLGVFSTFRFAALYHDRSVARMAAIMFAGSAAFFVMTNDIRCDTILTGAVITAIWLGCAWLESGRIWQLSGCAMAVSAALLAKGPIGAVAPLLAIGGQVIFARKWSELKDPKLLVVPIIIAALLLPMCIGLYQQHGAHGLRFFFWEQSFGRITGENRWKDDSTLFYFTHELLWQMLPWTVVILLGSWRNVRSLFRGDRLPEYASTVGALLVFAALSLSQFKLPHYLFVTLPLFAVIGASAWAEFSGRRSLFKVQIGLLVILFVLALLITFLAFPAGHWPFVLALCLAFGISAHQLRWSNGRQCLFLSSAWLMVAVGVVMNGHFYPNVLRYQANATAGRWAAENEKERGRFFELQTSGSAIDYYAGYPVPWIGNADDARKVIRPGVVIYTDEPHRRDLIEAGLVPLEVMELANHPAQRLSVPFLLPVHRPSTLEQRYLLIY